MLLRVMRHEHAVGVPDGWPFSGTSADSIGTVARRIRLSFRFCLKGSGSFLHFTANREE